MNDIELNKKLINLMESAMVAEAKPDFADIDDDGDEKETMKKAAKDKEAKKVDEAHVTVTRGCGNEFAPFHPALEHGKTRHVRGDAESPHTRFRDASLLLPCHFLTQITVVFPNITDCRDDHIVHA